MSFTNNMKCCLTYPLMWVMLLWGVTLPGHELAVYSYLVKGSATAVAPSLQSAFSGGITDVLHPTGFHVT